MTKTTRMLTALLTIAVAITIPLTAVARDIHSKAGTSAFPFLKMNVGARAVAMGGAFTGLADDAQALYYNPAGIAGVEGKQYVGGYHNYFSDIQSGFLGTVFPLNEQSAMGFAISYLNYGEFIKTDDVGTELGTFGGGDLLLAVSYARQASRSLKLGLTAKYIYETVEDYSATGIAFDLGAKYSGNRERFAAGLMIQNLGKQLSSLDEEKYDLPLQVRSGISFRPRGLPLTLASDVIIPIDNNMDFALGVEYHEFKPLYARIGWNSFGSNYRSEDSDDKWAGFGIGVGFDLKRVHIAYALAPGAELGDSHRITMSGGF